MAARQRGRLDRILTWRVANVIYSTNLSIYKFALYDRKTRKYTVDFPETETDAACNEDFDSTSEPPRDSVGHDSRYRIRGDISRAGSYRCNESGNTSVTRALITDTKRVPLHSLLCDLVTPAYLYTGSFRWRDSTPCRSDRCSIHGCIASIFAFLDLFARSLFP